MKHRLTLVLTIRLVSSVGVPEIATTSGPEWSPFNGSLSYLTGQRLSACTCPDDPSHPGPKKANGDWTGRSAPEIDLIEAQVCRGRSSMLVVWSVYLHLAILKGYSIGGIGYRGRGISIRLVRIAIAESWTES
jgi:hypothetical protein